MAQRTTEDNPDILEALGHEQIAEGNTLLARAKRLRAARANTSSNELVDIHNCEHALRLSPRAFRRGARRGDFGSFLVERRITARRADVQAWLDSRRVVPRAATPAASPDDYDAVVASLARRSA